MITMKFRKERTRASLAISIVTHVVLISALFSIVFRYPLGQLMGIPRPKAQQERITYVKVAPTVPASSNARPAQPEQGSRPAALTPPTTVPDELPPPDTGTSRSVDGDGRGKGVVGAGIATGVVPLAPDPRIPLSAGPLQRVPATVVETVDSLILLSIGIVNDSLAAARDANKHPEWIKKTRLGDFGLTKQYIALGPVKIPTALLALTALNAPNGPSPIEKRRADWIRADILYNAQRSISEEEFRNRVKQIRQRKEREAREKAVADAKTSDKTKTTQPAQPVIP